MKTHFVSPNGRSILKTQKGIDCPFIENPNAFGWCKNVGLFIDPNELPLRSTGRTGGFFGTENGRCYSFPITFSYPTVEAVKNRPFGPVSTVGRVKTELGGGYVEVYPGLPSAIKNMFLENVKMKKSVFESALHRAVTMKLVKKTRSDYWSGFCRGLRRRYYGENFGTDTEHNLWLTVSGDESRNQRSQGYRDGYYGLRDE